MVDIQEGKDGSPTEKFVGKCEKPQDIKHLSMDMSPAFVSAAQIHLPDAAITFDKFHIVRHLNKLLDDYKDINIELSEWCRETLKHLYGFTDKTEMSVFLLFWTDYIKELLGDKKIEIINPGHNIYVQSQIHSGNDEQYLDCEMDVLQIMNKLNNTMFPIFPPNVMSQLSNQLKKKNIRCVLR